ncbi:MAG TPA: guanylate kinase [Myxococcota bacterium]|nr:guanylate kinase [Myxococcota bacterium]
MSRRGIPFVVSGPSGVGKSTIVRQVIANDRGVAFSISHTTRRPRAGEKDGVDYFFVDRAEFQELIAADAFLEHAEYQGNLYGTSRAAVARPTAEGYDLILEVEIQGAQQLRKRLPEAVRIFIEPPSFEILEERLRGRSTETDDVMRARLERAREELAYADQCHHRIVNESIDAAVDEFLEIVREARKERG